MPAPIIAALLAAGTAVAGHIGKKEQAKEARKVEAIKAKYSPWTGVAPSARSEDPALMPDILAGAGAALASTQASDNANFWKKLMTKKYGMDQDTMQTNRSGQFGADPALAGLGGVQGHGQYSTGGGWEDSPLARLLAGTGIPRGGRTPV